MPPLAAPAMETAFELPITRQPDDLTCGPTCLQAVYSFFGLGLDLDQVIAEVRTLEEGGTLAVMLGCHALGRGFSALLFSYDLQVFDPTWAALDREALRSKLEEQAALKPQRKLQRATTAYLEFLRLGGVIRFEEFSGRLLRRFLDRGTPILTGLSATYLYGGRRERPWDMVSDDLRGEPVGHFVVLCGYDRKTRTVRIADPQHPNELSQSHTYAVGLDRLTGAILLGGLTYDANLLILEPKKG